MTYRIMAIHDIHVDTPQGRLMWAYARRTSALKHYAPPDMEFDTFQYKDVPWHLCGTYDLVYQTEYAAINRKRIKGHPPRANVPLVASYNSDSRRRLHYWPKAMQESDFLIVNNLEAFNFFKRPQWTCCISNGVCGDTFEYRVPIENRPEKIFWRGSSGPTKGKGWHDVLRPAMQRLGELGFEPDFKPVDDITPDQCATTDRLVDLYNQSSYVVCTSASEGTPNYLLEAASVGCVPVSCRVGNIQELGVDGDNCIFIERTTESLIAGLLRARELKRRLSNRIRESMQSWLYGEPGHRAQWYYALFRRIIEDGFHSVKPFSYHETHWSQI